MNPRITIEELGKPPREAPRAESRVDLQDTLVLSGILCGEAAAAVIWWPSALVLAALFCFAFAYLIERSKPKERHGPRKP